MDSFYFVNWPSGLFNIFSSFTANTFSSGRGEWYQMDRVLKGLLSLKIVNLIIKFTVHHNYFHCSKFFVLLSFGVSACGVYNFVDVFNFLIKKVKMYTIRFCLILPHCYFILFTNRLCNYMILIRHMTENNIKMLCTTLDWFMIY